MQLSELQQKKVYTNFLNFPREQKTKASFVVVKKSNWVWLKRNAESENEEKLLEIMQWWFWKKKLTSSLFTSVKQLRILFPVVALERKWCGWKGFFHVFETFLEIHSKKKIKLKAQGCVGRKAKNNWGRLKFAELNMNFLFYNMIWNFLEDELICNFKSFSDINSLALSLSLFL